MKDAELLKRYYRGDTESLGVLWKKYEKKIYNAIFPKTGGNIELTQDVLQDGFIKAMQSLDKGGFASMKGKSIGGWFIIICSNLLMDYYRAKKRDKIVTTKEESFDFDRTDLVEEVPDIEQIVQDEKWARKMINSLPEEQRTTVIKRLYRKLGFAEIAKEEQVSINTALGRMRYALINLKKIIDSGEHINKSSKIYLEEMGNHVTWKDIMDFLDYKIQETEEELKSTQRKIKLIEKVSDGIKQIVNMEAPIPKVKSRGKKKGTPTREKVGKPGSVKYSYKEAQEYVSSLGLRSGAEYTRKWDAGEIPKGIPKCPSVVYKDKGWKGWFEYLGKKKKND